MKLTCASCCSQMHRPRNFAFRDLSFARPGSLCQTPMGFNKFHTLGLIECAHRHWVLTGTSKWTEPVTETILSQPHQPSPMNDPGDPNQTSEEHILIGTSSCLDWLEFTRAFSSSQRISSNHRQFFRTSHTTTEPLWP